MTPLLAIRSVLITFAFLALDSTRTPLLLTTLISSPPAVSIFVVPSGTLAALNSPGTTCRRSTAFSFSIFSGFNRSSKVPVGSLANASSLGAKTVNGPSPLRISTNLAATIAVKRVDNSGVDATESTMFGSLLSEMIFSCDIEINLIMFDNIRLLTVL